MRLALTLICIAAPAMALAAGDRYGPDEGQAAATAPAASPAPYAGRVLQWPEKQGRFARLVASAPSPAQPASPPPAPAAVSPAPVAPLASLYRPPQAPPAPPAWPAPPPPVVAAAPPPPPAQVALAAPAQPAPPVTPAPPAVPQARVAMAQPPAGQVRVRFYSLHREYGDTPDAVTLPTDRPPVLIGPADDAPQIGDDPEDNDAKPKHHADSDGIY